MPFPVGLAARGVQLRVRVQQTVGLASATVAKAEARLLVDVRPEESENTRGDALLRLERWRDALETRCPPGTLRQEHLPALLGLRRAAAR